MKRKTKQAKVSKLDAHASSTAKSYSNSSTSDIERRQSLLEYEITLQEARITELQMLLSDTRAEKATNEATLKGLRQVVGSR